MTEVRARVAELCSELVEIRHDIHRHPELGFTEVRTQALVRDKLEGWGYAPETSAGTGLWADLNPGAPRTIALRADLDALPIHEHTELPYRSVHDGVSHKCGHDGHTSILLGAARVLSEQRDRIGGNVRLLFQPAEEGVRGGGAKVMIADGALDGVDEVYGLHNWPGFPKGEVRVVAGPTMAQVDTFRCAIEGKGGHGGHPQDCRDPIVAGAHVVVAIQAAVARGVGSSGSAVVTVGAFHAGTTFNVVPREAELIGTIRTWDPNVREALFERLGMIVEGTAAAHGTRARFRIDPEYPALVNDAACAEVVRGVAERIVGGDRVSDRSLPLGAAEDFAYFAQQRPAAYFFLGAGVTGEDTPGCHHPDFDFDDDLIPLGIELFCGIVEERLGPSEAG